MSEIDKRKMDLAMLMVSVMDIYDIIGEPYEILRHPDHEDAIFVRVEDDPEPHGPYYPEMTV